MFVLRAADWNKRFCSSGAKVCPMVCQPPDSPEEVSAYPEGWILQGPNKKELSEAGWVRRIGLPLRNFLTYATDHQPGQTSFSRGLQFKGLFLLVAVMVMCEVYGFQPNN